MIVSLSDRLLELVELPMLEGISSTRDNRGPTNRFEVGVNTARELLDLLYNHPLHMGEGDQTEVRVVRKAAKRLRNDITMARKVHYEPSAPQGRALSRHGAFFKRGRLMS